MQQYARLIGIAMRFNQCSRMSERDARRCGRVPRRARKQCIGFRELFTFGEKAREIQHAADLRRRQFHRAAEMRLGLGILMTMFGELRLLELIFGRPFVRDAIGDRR